MYSNRLHYYQESKEGIQYNTSNNIMSLTKKMNITSEKVSSSPTTTANTTKNKNEKPANKYGLSNPLRAPTKGATKHVSSEQVSNNIVHAAMHKEKNPIESKTIDNTGKLDYHNILTHFYQISSEHAAMHKEKNPIESQTTDSTGKLDYHNILTQFYQKYNAAKIGEVAKTLHRYKGYEPKMFAKLAQKYNAPNPLFHSMDLSASTIYEEDDDYDYDYSEYDDSYQTGKGGGKGGGGGGSAKGNGVYSSKHARVRAVAASK